MPHNDVQFLKDFGGALLHFQKIYTFFGMCALGLGFLIFVSFGVAARIPARPVFPLVQNGNVSLYNSGNAVG